MSLRNEILGLLYYKPATGYEITKTINSDGMFFWQAQQSQVYREIAKLEEDGAITAGKGSTEHKKIFAVTKQGKSELKKWLNSQDMAAATEIRNPLVMQLFFSNLADKEKTLEMFREYKQECKRILSQIADEQGEVLSMAKEKEDTVFFSLASIYGVGYYNFAMEWADKCIAVLERLLQK